MCLRRRAGVIRAVFFTVVLRIVVPVVLQVDAIENPSDELRFAVAQLLYGALRGMAAGHLRAEDEHDALHNMTGNYRIGDGHHRWCVDDDPVKVLAERGDELLEALRSEQLR